MPVQAAGLDAELGCQPAHRQVAEAVPVEDRERSGDHGLARQPHGLTVAQSDR